MTQEKVTILDLHNLLKDIVCKYPYYEVYTTDALIKGFMSQKLKPKAYIDRKNRKLYLKTTLLGWKNG